MKTIGIIGGMSWESSATYYRLLNEMVKEELGGLHSAKTILYSLDFAIIEEYQTKGEWEKAGQELWRAARSLESAGADLIVLATNTMHKIFDVIENRISVPIIHIGDATAEKIKARGLSKIGLLGTIYTMEQDFYIDRLQSHGIEIVVPNHEERREINRIIFSELVLGEIESSSKKFYLEVIESLRQKGVEGIVLGCTEIGLLIEQEDIEIPLFDTTTIHVEKALELSLNK